MNKEVRELIDTLKEYANGGVSGLYPLEESVKALLDYINQLETNRDEAIKKLDSFIGCCKCEKLESGSDYLHHQYWDMFERFNKQVKEILERGKE